jgi:hypothetical protein
MRYELSDYEWTAIRCCRNPMRGHHTFGLK